MNPYDRVADRLFIGDMTLCPRHQVFTRVVTLAATAGVVGERVRNRHIALDDSVRPVVEDRLREAIQWTRDWWLNGHRVLVRSTLGLNRPGLVVAALFIDMGARPEEAIDAVRQARPGALWNPLFVNRLNNW